MDVQLPGRTRLSFGNVVGDVVAPLLDAVLAGELPQESPLGQHRPAGNARPYPDVPYLDEHPFLVFQRRLVLASSGLIDPRDIDEYIARGGYSALARTLRRLTPDEVCDAVLTSGLRGRGGGGFPAGRKWKLARQAASEQRYLICNADEGDPGAFMDRAVCESDPHRLLEGMITRRVCHRREQGVHLHPGRIPPGRRPAGGGDREGSFLRAPGPGHLGERVFVSTCSSRWGPAPLSAARRRR